MSQPYDEPRASRLRPLDFIGLLLLCLSAYVLITSFIQMGGKARGALLLTAYVVPLAPGTEKTFGYGGETGMTQDHVPLQGREMSNRAFKVSRGQGDGLKVVPLEDRIRYAGRWYDGEKNSFDVKDGERFTTRGPLGSATFIVRFDRQSNALHLRLSDPIYREFDPQKATRLVFGIRHVPLPAPVDEIFFRVGAGVGRASGFTLTLEGDGLHLTPERDLSDEPVNVVRQPADSAATPMPTPAPAGPQAIILASGRAQAQAINGLELAFVHVSPDAVKWYGLKLFLAILLIGAAFLRGPQVPITNGFVLFSAVTFLLSLGTVLSARDFFFAPHAGRFEKYIQVAFWAAMLLYGLRYTHAAETADAEQEKDAGDNNAWVGLLVGGICFVVAFCALNGGWDEVDWSLTGSLWVGWKGLAVVMAGWILVLMLTHVFYRVVWFLLREVATPPLSAGATWIIFGLALAPLCFYVLARLLGFSIMLAVPVIGRIYLPVLFLPIMVAGAVMAISAAETGDEAAKRLRNTVLILLWGTVAVYRFLSGDNGGTLIVVIGLLGACWVAMRDRRIPALLTLLMLAGGVWALLSTPERFELAWQSEEAQVHYFDEAKNLRTARDLARAGGWTGQWLDLRIPSDVRGNIHNDLASAYVAGYFGWLILGVSLLAYALIYMTLWGALSGLQQPDELYALGGFPARDGGADASAADHRMALTMIAGCLVFVLFVQNVWAFAQPLQPLVPLVGFDLQPISTSGSSVLSFLVVLIGSVCVAQVASRQVPSPK